LFVCLFELTDFRESLTRFKGQRGVTEVWASRSLKIHGLCLSGKLNLHKH